MIRIALWLIAIAAAATALALFAADNTGVVSIFRGHKRLDMSLNLVLLTLLLFILAGYAVLRFFGAVSRLPEQAQHYRQQQHRQQMYQMIVQAMSELGAGRFGRAQKSAEKALEHGRLLKNAEQPLLLQARSMAHYLAAESAHRLGKSEQRETHYSSGIALSERAKDDNNAAMLNIRRANWLLHETDAQGALEQLGSLPGGVQRRVLALRLRLKASRLAQDSKTALETARLLNKHGAFSESTGRTLVKSLAISHLSQQHDAEQIRQAWLDLHEDERALPEITALAGKRVLSSFEQDSHAAPRSAQQLQHRMEQARQWLMPMWKRYADLQPDLQWQLIQNTIVGLDTIDNHWLRTIEQKQNSHPHDSKLRYLAGVAYIRKRLWGKAQQMFQHITRQSGAGRFGSGRESTAIAREVVSSSWCYLALLAQQRGDIEAANHAWNQAYSGTFHLPE